MKLNVLFAVNGIGLGHVVRSIRLAERLMNHYNVIFVTYGDAYEYLKDKGYNPIYLPPINLEWGDYGVAIGKTILSLMFKHSFTFIKHLITDSKVIGRYSPNFLVSDSRLSPLIISKKLAGIPSVLITNQLISYIHEKTTLSNHINYIFKWILPKIWSLSDLILITDMPPPYTISGANIVPALKRINKKICFIGLLDELRKYDDILKKQEDIHDIYFSISGPKNDRLIFSRIILSILRKRNIHYNVIVSLGNPNRKFSRQYWNIRGNILVYSWITNRLKTLANSKIIVLRGGQTSILEAILLVKPMIIIPAYGQTEQISNGLSVYKLGIGEYINPEVFHKKPHIIIEKINHISKYYDYYIGNLKRIRNVLIKCGGIDTALRELNSLIRRVC